MKWHRFVAILFLALLFAVPAHAQPDVGDASRFLEETVEPTGVARTDVATAAGEVVRILLTVVGIGFFVMMVYAGIRWMTARGEEEAVTKARKAMIAASIGLVIIVSAYGFSVLVTTRLLEGLRPSEPGGALGGGGRAGGGWDALPLYEFTCVCDDGFASGGQVEADSESGAIAQLDCADRCLSHGGFQVSRVRLIREGVRAAEGTTIGCCFDKVQLPSRPGEFFDRPEYWTSRMTTQADCESRGTTEEPLDVLVGAGYWQWNAWDAVRCDEEFREIEDRDRL